MVRKGRRFLVVRERKHGQRWYLPAGRVEPGERLADGAVREALEESGVPVVLEGIVRIQHTPGAAGARLRVVFVARPADDTEPGPTEDALDAKWVTLEELAALPMRGSEVAAIFAHVAGGGAIYPLSLLSEEGAGW